MNGITEAAPATTAPAAGGAAGATGGAQPAAANMGGQ